METCKLCDTGVEQSGGDCIVLLQTKGVDHYEVAVCWECWVRLAILGVPYHKDWFARWDKEHNNA